MSVKKRNKWFLVLLVLLMPLIVLWAVFKIPAVQTWIAQEVADHFSEEMNTKITLEGFSFDWGLNIHLEQLVIFDDQQDTLLSIQDFVVTDYGYDWDKTCQLNQVLLQGVSGNVKRNVQGDWNFKNLEAYFLNRESSPTDTSWSMEWDIQSIHFKDLKFNFTDDYSPDSLHSLHAFESMEWQLATGSISEFYQEKDKVHAVLSMNGVTELGGFCLSEMSGTLDLHQDELTIKNFRYITPNSDINGELEISAEHQNFFDFDRAQWNVHLHAIPFHTSDISCFFPTLFDHQRSFYGQIDLKGNLASVDIGRLQLSTGRLTKLDLTGKVRNLLQPDSLYANIDVKNLQTDDADVKDLLRFVKQDPTVIPPNIATLGLMTYQGFIQAAMDDWRMYGNFETAIGDINGDVEMRFLEEPEFNGYLEVERFNLGEYYFTDQLGPVTANLDIQGSGLALTDLELMANGQVESFYAAGYNYHQINLDGQFKNNDFEGDVKVKDVNADLDFSGHIDFSTTLPELVCHLVVRTANLKELGVFSAGPYSSISGSATLNSRGLAPDEIVGNLTVSDVSYCTEDADYVLDYLELEVNRDSDLSVLLNSDIAIGELKGQFTFEDVVESIKEIAYQVIPKVSMDVLVHSEQRFELNLEILDFSQISAAFGLDLGMAQNARLKLSVDETKSYFDCTFITDSLSTNDVTIYGGLLDITKPDNAIYAALRCDSIKGKDTWVQSMSVDARAEDDLIYFDWVWGDDSSLHQGDVGGKFTWNELDEFQFDFYRGDLRLKTEEWKVRDGSSFAFKKEYLRFNDLALQANEQSIEINGELARSNAAPLLVGLNNVNFTSLNAFLPPSIQLQGIADGSFALQGVFERPQWTSNINISQFGVNQEVYGDIYLESAWNEKLECIGLNGGINKGKKNNVVFEGLYFPNDSINPIDIDAKFSQFNLAFIQSFVDSSIIEIDGFADADIKVTGTLDNPQLFGSAMVKNGKLGVDYLKTTYWIDDRIWIEPDRFVFQDIVVKDEIGGKGLLTGYIGHSSFADWRFDILANLENEPFRVLNTQESDNPDYFGRANATGYFHLSGTTDALGMDMAFKTASGTKLNLPMSGGDVDEFGQFIHFVSKKNAALQENLPMDLSGISLDIQIDITPDAELAIIFDEAVGDVMKGKGTGHISLGISKLATFDMYGQIEITSGSYLFTLKNLVNKEFQIQPGGSIAWFGNPYEAELNLNAMYKVNASLSDILAEQSAVSGQRVPVDLIMTLRGKMLNPSVDFKIDLPTVDPLTKSRFESVVSTEQERNRQAFALLVLRQFVNPPNIVKATNTTTNNLFVENSTELLSSQISNWLSQISDDFNLGFNYRSGDQISNEEVALALSTQLFDNRVQLSGNFGVSRGNAINQQPSNYIGDVKVEYLLTKEGRLKLIAYNESNNYRNVNTQQSPYTQGVGIVYQQEFNHWSDLIRKKQKQPY